MTSGAGAEGKTRRKGSSCYCMQVAYALAVVMMSQLRSPCVPRMSE